MSLHILFVKCTEFQKSPTFGLLNTTPLCNIVWCGMDDIGCVVLIADIISIEQC